jgi:capsular polysaccharide biosynthesis protein
MKTPITVHLPVNVGSDDLHLFEPYLKYKLSPQKVKTFKNVFVTYTGFCINNRGLIKESHHDHPHQMDDYLVEASYYYHNAIDLQENQIVLDDDKTYLLIHHPWYNYYHWICESVFRAWMVKDKKDDMILILPDYYGKTDFVMGSLEPFGFKNIFFIPANKSLLIRTLCLPQIKPKVDSYNYKMVNQIKQFYLQYVIKEKKITIDIGERIYISRKKAHRKKIFNEEELETILLKYKFSIVNNEDYCFLEQVAIYSKARYLVSIHGSGLTNMLFMVNGSSIMEFHKRKTNDADWYSPAFWYFADALGYKYYHQMCEPTNVNDDYFNANYIVDIELFNKNLELMFSQ